MQLRPATPADAADLARFALLAGEGLPAVVWAAMAGPGETALAVGERRARRDAGDFSWRNAVVAEAHGHVAAGLVTYRVPDDPVPLDGLPAAFRNLQALENLMPGGQYVNVLAVYPGFRGRGLARALLAEAARRAGPAALGIIVADRNRAACGLYVSEGYAERARVPIVRPEGWNCASTHWVLLVRPPGGGLARPRQTG